jgi:hypothetical protein
MYVACVHVSVSPHLSISEKSYRFLRKQECCTTEDYRNIVLFNCLQTEIVEAG